MSSRRVTNVHHKGLWSPHIIARLRAPVRNILLAHGAWMECPPTKCPVNILSQTKRPPNISPHVTFCPSDILSPIYNVPRFYVHP